MKLMQSACAIFSVVFQGREGWGDVGGVWSAYKLPTGLATFRSFAAAVAWIRPPFRPFALCARSP